MRIIVLPVGRCRFLEENESGLRFPRNKIWRFTECTTPYNRPSRCRCTRVREAVKAIQVTYIWVIYDEALFEVFKMLDIGVEKVTVYKLRYLGENKSVGCGIS